MWATSSRIGCAINVCYNMNVWGMIWAKAVYLVCNYSPPYVLLSGPCDTALNAPQQLERHLLTEAVEVWGRDLYETTSLFSQGQLVGPRSVQIWSAMLCLSRQLCWRLQEQPLLQRYPPFIVL